MNSPKLIILYTKLSLLSEFCEVIYRYISGLHYMIVALATLASFSFSVVVFELLYQYLFI